MTADLSGLESSLVEANQYMSRQDYLSAKAKAQVVKEKAAAVQNEVRQAMERTRARGKVKKA